MRVRLVPPALPGAAFPRANLRQLDELTASASVTTTERRSVVMKSVK